MMRKEESLVLKRAANLRKHKPSRHNTKIKKKSCLSTTGPFARSQEPLEELTFSTKWTTVKIWFWSGFSTTCWRGSTFQRFRSFCKLATLLYISDWLNTLSIFSHLKLETMLILTGCPLRWTKKWWVDRPTTSCLVQLPWWLQHEATKFIQHTSMTVWAEHTLY